jgi:hypothetical protein
MRSIHTPASKKRCSIASRKCVIYQQADTEEARERRRMRWWFFGIGALLSVLWMIAVILLCWHVFDVTKNLFSLLISAANAPALEFMRRVANYLLVLPMDDKEFELEKARIEAGVSKPSAKSILMEAVRGRKGAQGGEAKQQVGLKSTTSKNGPKIYQSLSDPDSSHLI